MASFKLTKYAKMVKYKCMTIAELRKQNNITQKEAAELVGVPYRTYVRYEQNNAKTDSFKYKMIYSELAKKVTIDEEHGLLTVDKIQELLIPILQKHGITYCYLFGSYAKGTAKETSDVDLLVDTDLSGFDYFGLVEEIRTTLRKKIDLLRLCDLQQDNPIVLEILKEGVRLL